MTLYRWDPMAKMLLSLPRGSNLPTFICPDIQNSRSMPICRVTVVLAVGYHSHDVPEHISKSSRFKEACKRANFASRGYKKEIVRSGSEAVLSAWIRAR